MVVVVIVARTAAVFQLCPVVDVGIAAVAGDIRVRSLKAVHPCVYFMGREGAKVVALCCRVCWKPQQKRYRGDVRQG